MSVRVMSQVWELDLPAFEKLVLLALADCANDEGLAWPSIATLRRKTNAGERTVQRSLRALEAAGILKRDEVPGKGCKYHLDPRHSGTPAKAAPAPEKADTPATVAPKPSRTITNDLAKAKSSAPPKVPCPDEVSEPVWRDFTRQRKKPITDTALRGIKREAAKAGWLLEAALEEATTRGWESFKADWVKGKGNGNGIRQVSGAWPEKRTTRESGERVAASFARGSDSVVEFVPRLGAPGRYDG